METKITISINVIASNNQGDIHQIDMVEGQSMTEVLSKFLLVVNDIAKKLGIMSEHELGRIGSDDDIPF